MCPQFESLLYVLFVSARCSVAAPFEVVTGISRLASVVRLYPSYRYERWL